MHKGLPNCKKLATQLASKLGFSFDMERSKKYVENLEFVKFVALVKQL